MNNRGNQKITRNRKASARTQPVSWGYFFLTVLCASIMALGVFFIAVQHFISVGLGFKNSTMRKQIEDLEAEKRRLLLAKEVSLSPAEVTRTATKLGFREAEAVVTAASVGDTVTNGPASRDVTAIVSTRPINEAPKLEKQAARRGQTDAEVKPGIDSRPRVAATGREPGTQTLSVVAKLR